MDGLWWKTLLKWFKMDDLGVPLFLETPKFLYINIHLKYCIENVFLKSGKANPTISTKHIPNPKFSVETRPKNAL